MKTVAPDILLAIERSAENMPAVSPILGKIHQMSREMETSPRDLVKLIMLDPTLTGKVLKLVNSSFYGLVHRVKSLPQAVVLLGMNTVKNLAVSTALLSTVFVHEKRSPLSPEGFWRHCLATAVGCRAFAKKLNLAAADIEMFFIAGLLHDVGKILFIRIDPDRYALALSESKRLGLTLAFAELAHFGCSHAQAGGMLARKWKLDAPLIDVIELHHVYSEKEDSLRGLVTVANNLSKRIGAGDSGNYVVEEAGDALSWHFNITSEMFDQVAAQLPAELEKAAEFLSFIKEC
ncbi:MAG: HDOD domain-containing protein [Pseudomonadota bacterium]